MCLEMKEKISVTTSPFMILVLVQNQNLFSVCTCDILGATNNFCDPHTGHCLCNSNYISGNDCEYCLEGYYGHPNCEGLVNFFYYKYAYISAFFSLKSIFRLYVPSRRIFGNFLQSNNWSMFL